MCSSDLGGGCAGGSEVDDLDEGGDSFRVWKARVPINFMNNPLISCCAESLFSGMQYSPTNSSISCCMVLSAFILYANLLHFKKRIFLNI